MRTHNIWTFLTFFSKLLHEENDSTDVKNEIPSFSKFLIDHPGCRIPDFHPFSREASNIFITADHMENFFCDQRFSHNPRPKLLIDDENFLYFNLSAIPYYSKNGVGLHCQYSRLEKIKCNDNTIYATSWKPLNPQQRHELINEEFIVVKCLDKDSRKIIYRDYFAFVPRKNETENRCRKHEREHSVPSINTLIIGLDSISRLQFLRQFNKSSKIFKNKMKSITMKGYNKVGENTLPNLTPILTGLHRADLKKLCLNRRNPLVDRCPLIFKTLEDRSFRTIYAEDAPKFTTFNYGTGSCFHDQPTDYYLRPILKEIEKNIGAHSIGCGLVCYGSRSSFEFILGYAKKTARTFANDKYFAMFWSCSYTHDNFNVQPQIDETLSNFLNDLRRSRALNNTVLIIMADHGPRLMPEFTETVQGQYEKKLPLLSFAFPPWFKKQYPTAIKNLRKNSQMLTTHFDLHETFYDFMNLQNIGESVLSQRIPNNRKEYHGQSLFLPVSRFRTCSDVGIRTELCACFDQQKVKLPY